MSSRRLEAFSDGVFAIAITLLVLDLVVPARSALRPGGLGGALAREWPSYLAYVVSFLVIGIIWVNHQDMFEKVRSVDRPTLFANLALLLMVSVIPFPTRLLAEYLTAGSDAHLAAAVYSATMMAMGIAYSVLWIVITRNAAALLHEHIDARTSRAALRRFGVGTLVYLGTIGLAFINAIACLLVHGAIAVYYCFDQLPTAASSAPTSQADADG